MVILVIGVGLTIIVVGDIYWLRNSGDGSWRSAKLFG